MKIFHYAKSTASLGFATVLMQLPLIARLRKELTGGLCGQVWVEGTCAVDAACAGNAWDAKFLYVAVFESG